ncbi:hypothetical protein X975_22366, partial [Stegodyphus mimosarum]
MNCDRHTNFCAVLACKAVRFAPDFCLICEKAFSSTSCVNLPGKKNVNPSENNSFESFT